MSEWLASWDGGIKGAAAAIAVMLAKWVLDQIGGQWRKNRADARKTDAEADLTVGDAWRAIVAQLQERVAHLETVTAGLTEAVFLRDQIIIALSKRLPMSDSLRALMLKISPAAKMDFDETAREQD